MPSMQSRGSRCQAMSLAHDRWRSAGRDRGCRALSGEASSCAGLRRLSQLSGTNTDVHAFLRIAPHVPSVDSLEIAIVERPSPAKESLELTSRPSPCTRTSPMIDGFSSASPSKVKPSCFLTTPDRRQVRWDRDSRRATVPFAPSAPTSQSNLTRSSMRCPSVDVLASSHVTASSACSNLTSSVASSTSVPYSWIRISRRIGSNLDCPSANATF
jgi:hypothetical protein